MPLGARRIAFLRDQGIAVADLARIGGAPTSEARDALNRLAADRAQQRPPISPAARARLIEILTPAIPGVSSRNGN